MLPLDSKIFDIGKRFKVSQKALERVNVTTVHDALFHFPTRYEDMSNISTIADLKIGETATIKGRIELINTKRSPRRKMYITEALISDGTATMRLIWFNQAFIGKVLRVGDMVFMSGRVDSDYVGINMNNPAYEKLTKNRKEGSTLHTGRIVPVYSITSGLSSRQMRSIMQKCIESVSFLEEWLPENILKENNLMSYQESIRQLHFPENQKKLDQALHRLKFDELFVIQLYTQNLRKLLRATPSYELEFHQEETKQFVNNLSYELTDAQRKSAWDILQDLQRAQGPMNRLLEGDVGSGKTVVAAMALLNVYLNEHQSILLAPTEILAKQHFDSLTDLFKKHEIKLGLLTRATILYYDSTLEEVITIKKKDLIEKIARHEIDCVIGTHALLQDSVEFEKLALIIVDEQHRFGVKQRQALKEKTFSKDGRLPHFLSMTATPIPRSLALALYGDLDLSIINQMPKGRKPVETHLIDETERFEAYQFIREQINHGRQCFVVCPLVSKSDKLGVKSVEQEFEKLDKEIFKDLVVEKLHGKIKKGEKVEIMERMLANEIHILIATSVIEVGVNIPNATVMMIEGAERFGLAQLHQFRGRVGRSDYQSHCMLLTDSDSEEVQHRLQLFAATNNGFELAQIDLKNRGPGDVYGYRQSGDSMLQLAQLTDTHIIEQAQKTAIKVLQKMSVDELPDSLKLRLQNFSNLLDLE